MSKTKVIITGCGIAGPTLAIFLKQRGYEPVVYERHDALQDAGLSLCLQPNGLDVLSDIPGFLDTIIGQGLEQITFQSVVPEDEGLLGKMVFPMEVKETYGWGAFGVRRTTFHRQLVEAAEKHDVQIIWGRQLVSLTQSDTEVTVTFADGTTDTASFVVGCDGLHSDTRISLFGKEKADFTGLVQVGGISLAPPDLRDHPAMINVFGNGQHVISYNVTSTQCSWATTIREEEHRETWKSMDEAAQEKFKNESAVASWGMDIGTLIKNSEKIIKYGLYDRPSLQSWHKGRVVLVGDAAHPTSPHLGQGANQAFEDVFELMHLLKIHNPSSESPSNETLSTIFTQFEQTRIPQTTALVLEARRVGESRVVQGVEECKARNDGYRKIFSSGSLGNSRFYEVYKKAEERRARYKAEEDKAASSDKITE